MAVKKIPDLPAVLALAGPEQFETVQAGTSSRVSLSQMSGYIAARVPTAVSPLGAVVPNLAALKDLVTQPSYVLTQGYYAPNDGGGGPPWQWVAGSAATADDFMVVAPTSGDGRFIRQIQSGDAVSPKWAGAGLPDSPDDVTAILQKVINYGHAIDASGGTYPMLTCSILPGNPCPGIFSDGTATFVPAPTAFYTPGPPNTSNANGFVVTKLVGGFYFRRLKFACPIVTTPVTPTPVASRPIWFSAAAPNYGEDWEVSECHIEGYVIGIIINGGARNLQIKRNFITGTWADAISGPYAMDGVYIDHNTMFDGGFATGGPQPSGAIRVGTGNNTLPSTHLSISHNHIARYGVNASQSSIDLASGLLTSADVSYNICEDCGGSIEFKTGADGGDRYRNFNISFNLIKVTTAAPSQTGITVFYSQLAAPVGKGANFTIKGNKIYSDPKPLNRNGSLGIYVNGYDNVDVTNNTITNINQGIRIDGFNVTGTATDQASNYTISGNVIDVTEGAFVRGGGIINNLFIHNNPLMKSDNVSIGLNVGTVNNVSVKGNYIWSRASTAMDIRNVQGGVIEGNTIVSGITTVLFQGTPSSNVIVENNRIRSFTDPNDIPAISVTLTADGSPGAGLTDGLRTFTVTNGTGTEPTIFQWQVTGGVCVGVNQAFLQHGAYSVFPTVPTVTVDVGSVGTAAWTMTPAVSGNGVNLSGGSTGIVVQKNIFDLINTASSVVGTALAADNVRGTMSTNPNGVVTGVPGDIILNGALTATGPRYWLCTVAGTTWVERSGGISRMTDGTVALPSYTFTADATLGMSRTLGGLTFSADGKAALRLLQSGANNNYVSIASNNTPTISAIEGSGGSTPLQLAGAGNSGTDVMNGTAGGYIARMIGSGVVNANYLDFRGAAAGSQPLIAPSGSDTDIDLLLSAKGAGRIRLNNAGSFTANGTVAVTMTALGPTGASTTIKKWLTIKDNTGAVSYIPVY